MKNWNLTWNLYIFWDKIFFPDKMLHFENKFERYRAEKNFVIFNLHETVTSIFKKYQVKVHLLKNIFS